MSKTLKVGVIGVGGIIKTHMPGWAESEHAEVVAASDIVEDALAAFAAEHNISKTATDPADLFNDPDIDIIDVCTPNRYHAPLTIAALNAGKHVICEKPLAITPGEIDEMIAARDKSGKLLMTAQHFRFAANSRALKAEIDAGELGDIYHARSWMLRRAGAPLRPGFYMKKHSGGGPCIDIGVHILDLTLWMMGNPKPVSVTGVARTELAKQKGAFSNWGGAIPEAFDVEDFATAFVRFDNGATLILETSWLLHHIVPEGKAEDMQMWLYGSKAGSQWPNCVISSADNQKQQHSNRELLKLANVTPPHALECMEFARAVAEGAASPVPPEQSRQVMAILDGVYRSQQSGAEVKL